MQTNYDMTLMALAYGIAAVTCLAALSVAGRVYCNEGKLWSVGGALATGFGLWSSLFIGLQATAITARFDYSMPLLALALGFAISAAMLAFSLVNRAASSPMKLIAGGTLMGLGIGLMQYTGLYALDVREAVSFVPWLVVLSLIIPVSASISGLWLAFRWARLGTAQRLLDWQLIAGALLLGVAVMAMQYTSTMALRFPERYASAAVAPLSEHMTVIVLTLVCSAIMVVALIMSIYDAHLVSRTARLAASLKQANDELKLLVSQDYLTKLPNRLLLEERLDELLSDPLLADEKQSFSVFFVDLDRFKTINDSLGHHFGDELIRQAAARLKIAVREDDMVARVGGDEFMIVTAPGTGQKESIRIAERVLGSLSKAFKLEDNVARISASIGISLYPRHGRDKHELMVHADAAMYYAKDAGRNNFQFFEPGMTSMTERRSRLEHRLRLAVERETLSVAYQAKVDVASGEIMGVEALLRWQDEELGNVTPDEIIPLAEDTGLILPIGEWVLRSACRQALAWRDQGHPMLQVAVNISAIQLNNKHFIGMVRRVLEETGFPVRYLELEITESALMQNPDRAALMLARLRKLGIALSIDDFGTGYSNLSQIKRFPINRLKIDRSFTSGVTSDLQDAAIVKAVMALAHSLHLEVVAEGVETPEQLAFIRQLKGQQYQGYLCSRPLAGEDFAQFLTTQLQSTG